MSLCQSDVTDVPVSVAQPAARSVSVPPTIARSDEVTPLEVIQNDTTHMDCKTDGIPMPSITWLKNLTPYLDFPYENMRLMNSGKRLEVRNVQVRGLDW